LPDSLPWLDRLRERLQIHSRIIACRIRFSLLGPGHPINVSAQVNQSYPSALRRRQFLDTEQPIHVYPNAPFFPSLPNRGNRRRFAVFQTPPWNSPLPLQRMSNGLPNEQDLVTSQYNGTDINGCLWHRRTLY
jgi:hypothetical protein